MHKLYALLLAYLLPSLTQAFSLNTTTKYWNYTTSELASTTSQKCKDAYSADIACGYYLVQLVNANEERYFLSDMEAENFTQTCTAACHSSLTKYISNVKDACTESGDAAIQSLGFMGDEGTAKVPVQTIGHIFQYHLMRSCAKDEDGENCYLTQSSVLPADFSCDWNCALAYYWNLHFYPYSAWSVGNDYYVAWDEDENQIKYGNNMLLNDGTTLTVDHLGWKTILGCGFGNSTEPPFDIGFSGDMGDSEVLSVSKSSNSTSMSGNSTTSTATSTASGTSSSATPSSMQTGGAGKLFYFTVGYPAAVMVLCLYTMI
ncbi:hypothetical protein BDV29DRAFT_148414 [Aspergillus leporis]|uniref:Uncharacterized protein n=1 Tax=Aspergillus leporis TaxID=41062 RepID=A0A5N5X052_9EURO|nr:hypothetical protein BDV29DRAFT_148414 [Aspergillus leporis]